ncbi:hypothetical protein EP47_07075 [Legionella norrlandica]|uniref:Uncharacterized protein n=1 Tax=Legionella norrlandica TaxID=1498499 RepID=A0A0A2T929_9GAMM|nr:hypothetical protein [Legionella norrlandica]KGP63893.1 hypothetical protein EP47_07075 [Legionella norrlandica]
MEYIGKFFKAACPSAANHIRKSSQLVQPKKPIYVTKKQLSSLESWSIKSQYELMFAKKCGLPIHNFPISHSAIAFANHEDGTYAIYGRQSPFDLSLWSRDGIGFNTRKDNESNYLNDNFGFTLYPTGVSFSKDEINSFLNSADIAINQSQACNMINSNCYSYSTTAISYALQCLLARSDYDPNSSRQIIQVIKDHPLKDHCSFGVLNNQVVVDRLLSALNATKQQVKDSHSEDAKELLIDTEELIERVEMESNKYRISSLLS